mgnify:CR=1 FL=1
MSSYEAKLKAMGKQIKIYGYDNTTYKMFKIANTYLLNNGMYLIIENKIRNAYESLHIGVKEASRRELSDRGAIYVRYSSYRTLKMIAINIRYKGSFKNESLSICCFKTGYLAGIKDEIYDIMTEVHSKEFGTGLLVINRNDKRMYMISENKEVYEFLESDFDGQCKVIKVRMEEYETESEIKIRKITEEIDGIVTPVKIANLEVEE